MDSNLVLPLGVERTEVILTITLRMLGGRARITLRASLLASGFRMKTLRSAALSSAACARTRIRRDGYR